jgi:hypothetical protein
MRPLVIFDFAISLYLRNIFSLFFSQCTVPLINVVMRRLSKEAREMIDTGKVKTVCREETDERTTSSSVQREKRRIARQKERRATLILGKHCYTVLCALSPYSLLTFLHPPSPPPSAIPSQKILTPPPPPLIPFQIIPRDDFRFLNFHNTL